MKIRWLHPVNLNNATKRLRITPVRDFLQSKNISSEFIESAFEDNVIYVARSNSKQFIPVINKYPSSKFILDIDDNHFVVGKKRNTTLANLAHATVVTTSTEFLKKQIQEEMHTLGISKPIYIVQDPHTYPIIDSNFSQNSNLTVTWYGHLGNFEIYPYWHEKIFDQLSKLTKQKIIFNIICETKPQYRNYDNIEFHFYNYNFNIQQEIVSRSDFVIIPTLYNEPLVAGKGHNRVIDALALGAMPVVSPLQSYLKFSKYIDITESDFVNKIFLSYNNKEDTISRINAGQQFIRDNFTCEAISKDWFSVFEKVYNL